MPRRPLLPALLGVTAATAAAAPLLLSAAGPAAAAARAAVPAYTKTTLHFATTVGPANDIPCDVEGDLYVPTGVTAASPAPAILTSNGFGGSKDSTGPTASNATYADFFAKQGYVVLSYSGLGFGNSQCLIELDDPDFDGKAGKALVSYLGGAPGIGFTDKAHAVPVSPPPVVLDDAAAHDPRVGMIGGSYGGENQFAIAGQDSRVDTIIPQITWNDLAYSLAPNNQGLTTAVRQSGERPGTEKFDWVSLFFAVGLTQPLTSPPNPPTQSDLSTCPGFDSRACVAKANLDSMGYPNASTLALAQHASASSYLTNIHVPVFLSQGQDDTLFNLQEAIATYRQLKAQGSPVKMLWQHWGHSGGAVPGEADATKPVGSTFDDIRYSAWMDKYLRGNSAADTGPEFEYYYDWGTYSGSGPNTGQYAGAPAYPVGQTQTLALSGTGDLLAGTAGVVAGQSAVFTPPPAGAPASYTETSAVDQSQPVRDTQGTFAAYTSAPLAAAADQVGPPQLTVRLSAPSYAVAQAADPATRLVLFAKLYDLAPDGGITLVNRLIAPTRVDDVTKPVTIQLPAIVHRYPAGHRLQLVLATSDAAYKGNNVTGPVQVLTSPQQPGTLTVPLVNAGGLQLSDAAGTPSASVPETSLPAVLPLRGLGAGGLVLLERRRRARC